MTWSENPETILIVGADRVARTYVADNLTADGYEVMEAGSVASARRLLAQTFVDLAVVDRALPDGDGLDLVRFVRQARGGVARRCRPADDPHV